MDKIANSSGKRAIFRTKWTKSEIHPGKGRYLQHSNGCLNKREIVNLYQ